MQAALLEAALSLPPDERRELIDRLSESLDDDGFTLSPEQDAELDRRLDRLDRDGPTGEEWHVVRERLLARRVK